MRVGSSLIPAPHLGPKKRGDDQSKQTELPPGSVKPGIENRASSGKSVQNYESSKKMSDSVRPSVHASSSSATYTYRQINKLSASVASALELYESVDDAPDKRPSKASDAPETLFGVDEYV